jgi:hypothetical protein
VISYLQVHCPLHQLQLLLLQVLHHPLLQRALLFVASKTSVSCVSSEVLPITLQSYEASYDRYRLQRSACYNYLLCTLHTAHDVNQQSAIGSTEFHLRYTKHIKQTILWYVYLGQRNAQLTLIVIISSSSSNIISMCFRVTFLVLLLVLLSITNIIITTNDNVC